MSEDQKTIAEVKKLLLNEQEANVKLETRVAELESKQRDNELAIERLAQQIRSLASSH